MKSPTYKNLIFPFVYFGIIVAFGFMLGWIAHRNENKRPIYLPVKNCIVLRTVCNDFNDGKCGTLETYNCPDIDLPFGKSTD